MANFTKEKADIIVVGAGPSGIATLACLNKLDINNVVLGKQDCCAYLCKKKTYDRLHLHLLKDFCSLPFMSHAISSPKYMLKKEFIQYLDEYVEHFNITPKFQTCVESAFYNSGVKKWNVKSRNLTSGEIELYASDFLILATGENNEGHIPKMVGIENFKGEIIHSSDYRFGEKYKDKKVLVVGLGNSRMELAFDLSSYESHTSIVVRSPFSCTSTILHVEEEIVNEGVPPQGAQGDQVPQGNQVLVEAPTMTNEAVRSALLMIAQAVTTEAQAMTAQATRSVKANVNPNVSTIASRLSDFVRMNPSMFLGSKSDHQVRNYPILMAKGREAKQASLNGSDLDAPKRNRFYALQANKDKGAHPDEGTGM
ncbi:probable indole-3-pyruvate monooxygenase YUCCA10 [Solanum stenotomum]|uniref:probable indole-3-pyruvate monooxygenase YUCCA10 n=1 Tax=Solanum stenotomum TaxID=172797 RepID=UPI0020D1D48D|nr:probable indole-3-pyruvate monooxygenase YUCCA10 [Solanum stenotomum]